MKLTSKEFQKLLELAMQASIPVLTTIQLYDTFKRAHQLAAEGKDIGLVPSMEDAKDAEAHIRALAAKAKAESVSG